MYGSGLRCSGGGTARDLVGEDAQLATHVRSWSRSISEHTRTFETSNSIETESTLAAPANQ